MGERAVAWLVGRGIILPTKQRNIGKLRNNDGLGYEIGPRAEEICDLPPMWNEARRDDWLNWHPNGVELALGGVVACALECGLELLCPNCRMSEEVTGDALIDWEEKAEASLTCSACGDTASLDLWDGSGNWAFGRVGLTFWTWPPLKDEFKGDLGAALDGRVVHTVRGR
jgi:hypothetical protein